jgi:glycosyltransferase involved in cell wall biosynthesis
MPDVTVLMAVYNGERHVRHAIESILSQTHRDFEFVIVDDGSTDRTAELVSSYRDSRVRLVTMNRNVGLSTALNEGLRLAQAPLVARQDVDDLSEPERLARQLAAMAARPDLALLGTQGVDIDEDGVPTGTVRRCTEPGSIRWFSIFDNPFIHTSVMFRTDVARALGGFDPAYDPFLQDYDLWCRMMETHAVANLPDTLVRYRVSDTSIIGSLDTAGPGSEYRRRFERIIRELTARQTRRVLGSDALSDAEEPLTAGFLLGLERASIGAFLSLFERLLSRYRERYPDCASADFRWTLARQFDALAFRVRPPTRESVLAIYFHVLRHHPAVTASVSWPRILPALLLGKTGRDRLARWKRRHPVLAKH